MLMMTNAMIIPTTVESGVELEDDDDDDPVEPDDNITKKVIIADLCCYRCNSQDINLFGY